MSLDPKLLEYAKPNSQQYTIIEKLIEGMRPVEIEAEMSLPKTTVSTALHRVRKRAAKNGYSPDHDMTRTAPPGYFVKGTSTYYNKDGDKAGQWVKTSIDHEQFMSSIQEAVNQVVETLPVFAGREYIYNNPSDQLMAVYPLGDPHIGVLCLAEDAAEDWDLHKAQNVFLEAFDKLVKVAPKCKKALLVNLGDFFHADNTKGVTERSGHFLSTDKNYAAMVDTGLKIIIQMIESCLDHHEEVEVINAIGNHDDTGSMFLQSALAHMYAKEPRVLIHRYSGEFAYTRHGKCLIGVHHGHTAKMDKLPMAMAIDRATDWGEIGENGHRYWYTGHIHHDSKKEIGQVVCESFRTLSPRDNYAQGHGYRSGRDSKVLVLHKEHGEVSRHTINVSQLTAYEDVDKTA